MNLAPLMDVFVALASATLTACIPIVVYKLVQVLHLSLSTQQEASLNSSIATGLGKALSYGQAAGDAALSNVTIKNAALSTAASFVVADAPAAMTQLGYTPADVAEIVSARMAKLLHETTPAVTTPEAVKTAAMMQKADAAMAEPVAVDVPPAPAPAVAGA